MRPVRRSEWEGESALERWKKTAVGLESLRGAILQVGPQTEALTGSVRSEARRNACDLSLPSPAPAQPNPPIVSLGTGGAPSSGKLWKGKGGGEVESPGTEVEDRGSSNLSFLCTTPDHTQSAHLSSLPMPRTFC